MSAHWGKVKLIYKLGLSLSFYKGIAQIHYYICHNFLSDKDISINPLKLGLIFYGWNLRSSLQFTKGGGGQRVGCQSP